MGVATGSGTKNKTIKASNRVYSIKLPLCLTVRNGFKTNRPIPVQSEQNK